MLSPSMGRLGQEIRMPKTTKTKYPGVHRVKAGRYLDMADPDRGPLIDFNRCGYMGCSEW